MIGCTESVQLLWEYLDGTVGTEDRTVLEEHLARCRTCCGELEFAKELRGFLTRAAGADVDQDVLRRLNETIEGLG